MGVILNITDKKTSKRSCHPYRVVHLIQKFDILSLRFLSSLTLRLYKKVSIVDSLCNSM